MSLGEHDQCDNFSGSQRQYVPKPSPQEQQAQVAALQERLMEQRVSARERKVSTALSVLHLRSEYSAMSAELEDAAEKVLLDYLKAD